MNEHEVRALVREAVERHLGGRDAGSGRAPSRLERAADARPSSEHCSHILMRVVGGSAIDDGTCLIEPSVT